MAFKTKEALINTISQVDGKLFNKNAGRRYLSITNLHASQNLFVRFGTSAATTTAGIKIGPGVTQTFPNTTNFSQIPGDEVHVIADGNSTPIYAFEGDGNLMG